MKNEIHTHIRHTRQAARMTVAMLAERMAVDPSTIWRWERRIVPVPVHRAADLAAVLGISVDQIVFPDRFTPTPRPARVVGQGRRELSADIKSKPSRRASAA